MRALPPLPQTEERYTNRSTTGATHLDLSMRMPSHSLLTLALCALVPSINSFTTTVMMRRCGPACASEALPLRSQKTGLRISMKGNANTNWSRRQILGVGAGFVLLNGKPGVAAAEAPDKNVIKLKIGLKTLNRLLEQWDEQTTLCNFAEVPRELLETQNKAQLLEKAKVNALFDKEGAMVIKCKRNPVPIREAMGFNEDPGQPLYRADKTIKLARKRIDPDQLEDYIEAEERWSQLQSSLDSMSYGSAMRGAALGEFKKGDPEPEQAKFLESERREVGKARDVLQRIVTALDAPGQ